MVRKVWKIMKSLISAKKKLWIYNTITIWYFVYCTFFKYSLILHIYICFETIYRYYKDMKVLKVVIIGLWNYSVGIGYFVFACFLSLLLSLNIFIKKNVRNIAILIIIKTIKFIEYLWADACVWIIAALDMCIKQAATRFWGILSWIFGSYLDV